MKKISLFILAIALTITSCKNYDDEFKDLNASIAQLQTQVAGFSSLQAGLTALQSSVAALQTTVNALPDTQVDIAPLQAALTTSLANIAALQADLNTVIANYATSTDLNAAQDSIDALTTALAAAQADLDELLASNNVYDGYLQITNPAELAFALTLGDKVGIINGGVYVDATDLDAADVSVVTSKIMTVTQYVYNFSVEEIDFSNLVSIGSDYYVTGFDASDDALTSVGGWVYLDYDGGYTQPNLESADGVRLVDYDTDDANDVVGTKTVNFRNLETANLFTNGDANYTAVFTDATSVILNEGVRNLTANAATDVQVWAANNTALTISATEDDSVITIAGTVYSTGTTGGPLSVTGSATSELNAALLTKTSTLDVVGLETVSLPALTLATIVHADDAVSFSAPLLVATQVWVAAAKTISIASTPTIVDTAVETLTFSALASPYTAAATLKTATVTGKSGTTNGFTSTSATLASATFAGELDVVSLTGVGSASDKLTSVTTTGSIDSFTLNDSDVITSLSLGHSHIAGGAGSVLVITNNAKLASLTTSTNKLVTLTVTGNALLTAMDFSSYTSVIAAGAININITGNKLSGTYTNAVAAGANPYVETVITSTSLVTLKPYVNAWKAATTIPVTSTASLAITVDLQNVGTVATPVTLTAAQTADTAHLPLWSAGTYGVLDTVAEFLLIQ